MKAVSRLENPDDAEVTLAITMPLKDWKRLQSQLEASEISSSYPSWRFLGLIRELAATTEAHFTQTTESEN